LRIADFDHFVIVESLGCRTERTHSGSHESGQDQLGNYLARLMPHDFRTTLVWQVVSRSCHRGAIRFRGRDAVDRRHRERP
jgi:hypothetical protein